VSEVNLLNGIPSSVVGFSLSLHDIFKKKSSCLYVHYYLLCNSDSIYDLSAVALLVFVFLRTAISFQRAMTMYQTSVADTQGGKNVV